MKKLGNCGGLSIRGAPGSAEWRSAERAESPEYGCGAPGIRRVRPDHLKDVTGGELSSPWTCPEQFVTKKLAFVKYYFMWLSSDEWRRDRLSGARVRAVPQQ